MRSRVLHQRDAGIRETPINLKQTLLRNYNSLTKEIKNKFKDAKLVLQSILSPQNYFLARVIIEKF